ncbi:MAG TPA: hypothetical protein VFN23_21215, partial [Ktedonobacteraceae bacterium]|nr:hypothetical protein [Ktedonobacteraceae bacterium]
MSPSDSRPTLLRQLRALPLNWLHLSLAARIVLVTFSYALGISGLVLLFPRTLNGSSMFLPIVGACWLFRYRGLLISLVLNGLSFQLTYLFWLKGMMPDSAFMVGGIIGFVTSLGLGLVICWLRTAVDLVQVARQQAILA